MPATAQQPAGKATAAAPKVQAMLDQQSRSIAVGNPVFRDETITTGSEGHLHALLLDESNLTVGPDSRITIDEFVYDPDQGTGSMVMEQAEGVMRFVGGRISKENPVNIETPAATLGIRGGVVISWLRADGSQAIFFLFGDSLTVNSQLTGDSAETSEAGVQFVVDPDGTINGPDPIDGELLAEATGRVDTPPDGRQRASVPDAVLQNLLDRLDEQPIEPGDEFSATNQPITIEELEQLIGNEAFTEENVRDVFRSLREQQRIDQRQSLIDRNRIIQNIRESFISREIINTDGSFIGSTGTFGDFIDELSDEQIKELGENPELYP